MLIVEDEPILRSSVARGIAKLPGVEVLTAGTFEDAVRTLDVHPPQLVLSDLDLPDGSGVELLAELEQRRVRVPVLFVSAYVGAFRGRIPRQGNVEVYEKPVPIERLRAIVEGHLANASPDADPDDHAPFSLDEYLQLAAMGRHSVLLRAEIGTRRVGEIVVWVGEVRSAVDAHGAGPEAFRRLAVATIGRPDAHLAVRTLRAEPAVDDMRQESWQNLLFDAIRELDERRSRGEADDAIPDELHGPSPVDAPARRASVPATSSATFEELYELGVDALLGKRFDDAHRAFVAAHALRPGDSKVNANIRRLEELGYGA
ncbi:MAG: response regulator [Myxococcales bacterium]|nr:response regulator [Myxococcales bacterium]